MKKIILIFLVLIINSCNSRKGEQIKNENSKRVVGVSVTRNDSIITKINTEFERKYEVFGENDDVFKVLSDSSTINRVKGKFAMAIRDKYNHQNKMISFLDKENVEFPDLKKTDLIANYSLLNEYQKAINRKDLKTSILGYESWSEGKVKYNTITFSFSDKKLDTIGFQYSQFSKTKSSLVSIHYFYKNLSNYEEMNSSINKMANKLKK
jgi:hypothetical protein